MSKIPPFVYLVLEDSSWVVTAIADDHPHTPERISNEVERRFRDSQMADRAYFNGHCHVYRCELGEPVEVEIIPPEQARPQIVVKEGRKSRGPAG